MQRVPKARYTEEFKVEALKRVRSGEPVLRVSRDLGLAEQTLRNWMVSRAVDKPGLVGKGKTVTPEQMEISRLRAENARLKMEAEILKKAAAYFAKESL
jgi:transposase